MLLRIVQMEQLDAYRLRLTFNTGLVKEVDLGQHWDRLFGPVFQPLRDPAFFAEVSLPPDSETLEWPNGADLAAEFLYEIGETVAVSEPAVDQL